MELCRRSHGVRNVHVADWDVASGEPGWADTRLSASEKTKTHGNVWWYVRRGRDMREVVEVGNPRQ